MPAAWRSDAFAVTLLKSSQQNVRRQPRRYVVCSTVPVAETRSLTITALNYPVITGAGGPAP